MALERTFSIIKPDATKRNLTGKIIDRFERNQFVYQMKLYQKIIG